MKSKALKALLAVVLAASVSLRLFAITAQQQYTETYNDSSSGSWVQTTTQSSSTSIRVSGWTQICGSPNFLNGFYPDQQYPWCTLFNCGVEYLIYVEGPSSAGYDCKDAIAAGTSTAAHCCAAAQDFWTACLTTHAAGECNP